MSILTPWWGSQSRAKIKLRDGIGGENSVIREQEPPMAKQKSDSVYRIVDVVGVSEKSWEDAGRNAVETAAGSLRDLRVAEVTKMDMKVENGKVAAFRTERFPSNTRLEAEPSVFAIGIAQIECSAAGASPWRQGADSERFETVHEIIEENRPQCPHRFGWGHFPRLVCP